LTANTTEKRKIAKSVRREMASLNAAAMY
jgi:hypothetical protein